MGWDNYKEKKQNETSEKKDNFAYINKATKELAESDEFTKKASDLMLEKADEIMSHLQENGLSLKSTDKDGNTKDSKAVVEVGKAMKYNAETKEPEQIVHKDGTDAYSLKVSLYNENECLMIHAKDNVENGIELSSMSIRVFDEVEKKSHFCSIKSEEGVLHFYEKDTQVDDHLTNEIKAVAQSINEKFDIEKPFELSEMQIVARDLNKQFSEQSEKVMNSNNELVNNEYAQFKKDGFGERVELRSHDNNVVVELGTTSKGDKYAKATNFDMEKDESGKFPTIFLNNKEDVEQFVDNKVIAEAVKQYKNMDAKENAKTNAKAKADISRD